MIVGTYKVSDPKRMALWCSTCLAVDKGVPSSVERSGDSWLVIADDGKTIIFEKIGC